MRLAFASPAAATVIDAARHWRLARDLDQPVQPLLSARLGPIGGGLLAPVLDGLLTVFEAAFRRRFEAGNPSNGDLTGDEQCLIELLDHDDVNPPVGIRPDWVGALRTALRSTRIMLASVLLPPSGEAPAVRWIGASSSAFEAAGGTFPNATGAIQDQFLSAAEPATIVVVPRQE